ncbi:MAG TPA: hypothetical protein VHR45_06135 [Thermoanaerobaculia bacterium]|nr:hypothetical protein [Thermoanaerobaculia bacterium]
MPAVSAQEEERTPAGSAREGGDWRNPLLLLDPWLILLLGAAILLQVTGDPAFATLRQYSRWDGEVVRTVLAVAGVAVLLLFATAVLAWPERWSVRSYARLKLATLVLFGLLIVGAPVAQRSLQRLRSGHPLQFAHDGGVVQTEESARFLLRGVNPYAADFAATPLREVGIPAILHHNPYLPGSFLLSVPFVGLADALKLPFDQRWIYLAVYALGVWLAPRAFRHPGAAELARTGFALNPLVVPYLVVGRNDIYVIGFLLFAYVCLVRGRAIGFCLCLAAACAIKQFAWLIAPFLLLSAARILPAAPLRRGLAWGAALLALVLLPFFLWGPADFIDDIYRFNAGTSHDNYPLGGTPGFGFAMLAAVLGWAPDRNAYYPLTPYLLATAAPLALFLLVRLARRPQPEDAFFFSFLLCFWIFFFSRVFNNNYFGLLAFLAQMGALAAADRQLAAPATAAGAGRP